MFKFLRNFIPSQWWLVVIWSYLQQLMSDFSFLKYSCVCFQQDISGLQDHEFQTRFPEAPALLYQIRLGDEKLQVSFINYNKRRAA